MTPVDENQLAEAVLSASGPLRIFGGGTRGIESGRGTALSTSKLSGVTLYEPGALTIVAKAGTPCREIHDLLEIEGQRLAFEPADYCALLGTAGNSTIGGVVATNTSGPRRIQVGACRDFLLGVRFVDGQGRVIKNGGRVMKNVTGYDLCKLMAGSYGTLGVLSEVAFKVLPKSETSACLCIPDLSDVAAVQAMSAALGSPYDVSGAAHFSGGEPGTVLRLEGFADSVKYRLGALSERLAGFGDGKIVEEEESNSIWKNVRDVEPFHGKPGNVWRISVKSTDGPTVAARLGTQDLLFDWGGGLIWALVPEGTNVRERIGSFNGHATLFRGDKATQKKTPMFQPEKGVVAKISAGIRRKYDPKGILNPELLV